MGHRQTHRLVALRPPHPTAAAPRRPLRCLTALTVLVTRTTCNTPTSIVSRGRTRLQYLLHPGRPRRVLLCNHREPTLLLLDNTRCPTVPRRTGADSWTSLSLSSSLYICIRTTLSALLSVLPVPLSDYLFQRTLEETRNAFLTFKNSCSRMLKKRVRLDKYLRRVCFQQTHLLLQLLSLLRK